VILRSYYHEILVVNVVNHKIRWFSFGLLSSQSTRRLFIFVLFLKLKIFIFVHLSVIGVYWTLKIAWSFWKLFFSIRISSQNSTSLIPRFFCTTSMRNKSRFWIHFIILLFLYGLQTIFRIQCFFCSRSFESHSTLFPWVLSRYRL